MVKIQKYKVDDFEHYVPESIDEDFVAEVKKAGKSCQSIDDPYQISSDRHEEACNSSVIENKIFHSQDEVWLEAIQNVDVQIYEVYQSEKDNFIIHCPLEQIDALEHQIKFQKQQYEEGDSYPTTIREYQYKVKHSPNNECFLPLVPKDISSKELDYQIASLFSKELTKRNIKTIEDITMATATKTETNSAQDQQETQVVFDGANLSLYLKKCSREFLDELILTFGEEGVKALDLADGHISIKVKCYVAQ